MLADIPFEQRMQVEGREFRKSVLKSEIIASALTENMKALLKQIDECLLNHWIDPETIQLTPEEIEEAKKRKKEMGL